ncbi:MAG: ester cyclase [Verrucomicrobiota bacterium]
MKTGKEWTEEWFDRVWNHKDTDFIHDHLSPECVIAGLGVPARGPDGFLLFHQSMFEIFDDLRIEVTEQAEEGELVVGNARIIALHKASEKQVDFEFGYSVRWVDGVIQTAHNIVDYLSMCTQAGILEEDFLSRSLMA